ncbi:tpr [Campylobacter concisus UNSW1]|nr:tpr [Campylobacter concisus UNSW1]
MRYFSLSEQYEITVVTANLKNASVDNSLYPDIFDKVKEVIYIEDVVKNKYIKYFIGMVLPSIYKTPDEYKKWHKKAYQSLSHKFKSGDFDLILTFSFPMSTNILGRQLKKYFKCKWVAHQSDPWTDNIFNGYNKDINQKNVALEKECFDAADKIIFTSIETQGFYTSKYPLLSSKFSILEHSNDPSLYPRKDNVSGDKKVVRYIGGFYGARTPEPLYKALYKLKEDRKNIDFIFEIYGFGRSITNLLKKYDIAEYVSFKGSVSYLKSLELMVSADLLVLIDAPSEHKSIFFPSKLVDYIGSQTPIMVISPDGASKRVAEENGLAYFELNETDKIADYLCSDWGLSQEYGNVYDINDVVNKFVSIVGE